MVLVLGFVLAAVSAVCNGSFAALSKKYPSDPHVFNLQFCFGVLVSSMVSHWCSLWKWCRLSAVPSVQCTVLCQ
jgi:drug/metabolite transporter (DMT)-like permease